MGSIVSNPGTGVVTTSEITDGTIVDADINAAAAITETKLNLASDAAAATASRRTLGTTSTSAGRGDQVNDLAGLYRTFVRCGGQLAQNTTAATRISRYNTLDLPAAHGGAGGFINIVNAKYAVTGKTLKWRVQLEAFVNATAPAVGITAGIYPASSLVGANALVTPTLGSEATGSPASLASGVLTAGAVPAAAVTPDTVLADGLYVIGVANDGTTAANSTVMITTTLEWRVV